MAQSRVAATSITQVSGGISSAKPDLLAIEAPLEIRLIYGAENDRREMPLSITMRTPGNDHELAVGFLFVEGIISSFADILSIHHCQQSPPEALGNVLKVSLHPDISFEPKSLNRNFYTNSSCGVCGKSALENLAYKHCPIKPEKAGIIDSVWINTLAAKLREKQNVFSHTGGLHAAAVFHPNGDLKYLREDVGRHNALDKLIGKLLEKDLLKEDWVLMLSGRTSFELIQKTLAAGIGIVAAIGAPSSLAVELAKSFGITLLGFVSDRRFNIYSNEERLK